MNVQAVVAKIYSKVANITPAAAAGIDLNLSGEQISDLLTNQAASLAAQSATDTDTYTQNVVSVEMSNVRGVVC